MLFWCVEQKHFPSCLKWKHLSDGAVSRSASPFLIGQKFPQKRASTHQHLKICKSQQLEPQLILCYKDCKGHHFPDIHNKGINREEKCIKWKQIKTIIKKKKKNRSWRESGHFFFLYCMFFFILQNGLWSRFFLIFLLIQTLAYMMELSQI